MRLGSDGGTIVAYADGEVVFSEGDEGLYLYMVVSGTVRIRKRGDLVSTTVAELGPGEMFGESAIIEHRPRSADAVAVGATELACYDRHAFLEALSEDPELALRAMSALIERLRLTTGRLQELATQHVLDRAEMALTERAILESELA
jgi:CRP-like cAMP-binding protein